jgi:multicomponent Na+:H+ antiporter subunit E
VLRQALRLPAQSFLAGIEVARQAFLAKPTLKPGIVSCRTAMPEGIAREAFLMLASLQPGTLPVDEAGDGTVRLQAIDLDEDVPGGFGREEARFRSEVCPSQSGAKGQSA